MAWDLHGGKRPADAPYRFLLLVKADADLEAGKEQPAAVNTLLDQWKRDGLLQSATTLTPSKPAVRSKVVSGKREWTDGPFTESKELVAGFSILEVPTLDDAKRFTEEYAAPRRQRGRHSRGRGLRSSRSPWRIVPRTGYRGSRCTPGW